MRRRGEGVEMGSNTWRWRSGGRDYEVDRWKIKGGVEMRKKGEQKGWR